MDLTGLRKLPWVSLVIFISMMIWACVVGYKEDIPRGMIPLQLIIGFFFFCTVSISLRLKSERQLLSLIGLYSFCLSLLLRCYFIDYYGKPFGEAVDSYKYDEFANSTVIHGSDLFSSLRQNELNIDDFGFSSVVYFIYRLFSPEAGRWILLLFNSILTVWMSHNMYRTCILLHFDFRKAMFATSVLGLFPFLFVTSAVGLKEVVFCFLISGALYYTYKWRHDKKVLSLFTACAFITLTLFFRTAIAAMLAMVLLCSAVSNENNKLRLLVLFLFGAVLTVFVLDWAMQTIFGKSLEFILAVTQGRNLVFEDRALEAGADSGYFVQALGGLFGPFPNFTRYVQYGILHSSGLLFKCILGALAFRSVYFVVRRLDYIFYPVLLFLFLGLLMRILCGVALDMRYDITFFESFVIISLYNTEKIQESTFIRLYTLCVLAIIVMYNLR